VLNVTATKNKVRVNDEIIVGSKMEVLGWIALANFVKSWFDAASLTAVALFKGLSFPPDQNGNL
jgi:hypothetical protein